MSLNLQCPILRRNGWNAIQSLFGIRLFVASKAVTLYREVWFVVALAAASIVIILWLWPFCVKSKTSTKNKPRSMFLNEGGGSIEEGFSTFEMRQSRRGQCPKQGTMKYDQWKSSNSAMINSSRAPPRPTPSMVNYSDEDSGKGYDENPDDSDSLTEKPSEILSTDSGHWEWTGWWRIRPTFFVNHYANVNNTQDSHGRSKNRCSRHLQSPQSFCFEDTQVSSPGSRRKQCSCQLKWNSTSHEQQKPDMAPCQDFIFFV